MPESKLKKPLKQVASITSLRPPQRTGLLEVEPSQCVPWHHHNRERSWLRSSECADLIHSIQSNGQIEPVIVRALPEGSDKAFEIIAGVRRWFACSQLPNQKLLVRVIGADDRTCMILMHAENAHAQDITDFERAYSFKQHMKSGFFKNQMDLARAMGSSQSMVSKMIRATEIFETPWLDALFEHKRMIPIRRAYRLSTFLKNPVFYEKIEAEANLLLEVKKKRQLEPASKIMQRLIDCVQAKSPMSFPKVLLKKDEKPMVVVKEDPSGNLSLNLDSGVRSFDQDQIAALCMQAIGDYFLGIMDGSSARSL